MSVIAVLQQKGGSGKTTVAVHVARGLQLAGHRVLLVDADSQRSAASWRDAQDAVEMPDTVELVSDRIDSRLRTLAQGYDHVVIDGAPRMVERIAAGVRAADLVLIPVQPSGPDLEAASELVHLVHTRRRADHGRPNAAFVVNRVISNSRLAAEIDDALKVYSLPALEARLGNRVAYQHALTEGLTVFEVDRGKARDEASDLVAEIQTLL